VQELERHPTPDRELLCLPDLPHASAPKGLDQPEAADHGLSRELTSIISLKLNASARARGLEEPPPLEMISEFFQDVP
jgi:hypothetical protein